MAVLAPTITEAEEIGSPVNYIRVKWNDPAYGTANAATGFKLIHDDETGTLPAWTSAVDAALAGGGDGAGNFEVLLPVPLGGVAAWWETWAEYAVQDYVSDVSTLTGGGLQWDGPWQSGETLVDVSWEAWSQYPTGTISTTLNGGYNWNGQPWINGSTT